MKTLFTDVQMYLYYKAIHLENRFGLIKGRVCRGVNLAMKWQVDPKGSDLILEVVHYSEGHCNRGTIVLL